MNDVTPVLWVLYVVIALLPTIVVAWRRHHNGWAVLTLNILAVLSGFCGTYERRNGGPNEELFVLLGLLGWAAALVWSATATTGRK